MTQKCCPHCTTLANMPLCMSPLQIASPVGSTWVRLKNKLEHTPSDNHTEADLVLREKSHRIELSGAA